MTAQSHDLVLGPVLRHVDETAAAVWVEVSGRSTVAVQIGTDRWSAPSFAVHGHHYALVEVDGLEPGSSHEYAVLVDGEPAWPLPDSPYPPSRIRTLGGSRPLRVVFGSCRTSVGHDAQSTQSHGVDVLCAYALQMTRTEDSAWPDLVLFLGDQIYADETSEAMQEFIAGRRDIEEPPGVEVQDYEEYAHLYDLAWSEPATRWLLSTLPSAMIFDDHDVRDDWNTSAQWRADMSAKPWWHDRIVGALASYWVYQHLGNLSAAGRREDEVWRQIRTATDAGDGDVTALLDGFAERADARPDSYRWSYARDIGRNRLIVVDTRAARVLDEGRRRIVDDAEADWLDDHLRGDLDHLLIGTSLPYLLPKGLHHAEAWNEAVAGGAWGRRAALVGERIRQGIDLEHWAAFQYSFRRVAKAVTEVADGKRGRAPGTVTFLSGDVHHSYLIEVDRDRPGSRVLQVVCSPIRNPLPRFIRLAQYLSSRRPVAAATHAVARLAGVEEPPFTWRVTRGPWFANMLATLETDGRELAVRWQSADPAAGDRADEPALHTVVGVRIDGGGDH